MSKVVKGEIEDNKKIKTLSQKGYFNFNFSSVTSDTVPPVFGAKKATTSQKGYKFYANSTLPNSFNFGSNLPITFAPVFETKLETASSDPTDEANEVVNFLTEEIISKITEESKKFGLNENSVSLTGYQFDVKSTVPTSFNFGSVSLDAIPTVFAAPGNIKKIETAISETASDSKSDSDSSSNSSSSSDTN